MEKESLYNLFDSGFAQYKDIPIALYGLGINTKYLLEEAKTYNIVGIIANERIGEIVYEKEVMAIESVPGKVRIIIIIAQAKSIKTIYERIKYIEDTGIDIYDLYGKKLKDYYDEETPNAVKPLTFESASAMSSYDRMLYSSVANVIKYAVNKSDHNVLYLFSQKAFHDPLSFVKAKGKLTIDDMYKLGYYCFAPITANFLAWLVKEFENINKSIILFSSRDGYLLFKLYRYLTIIRPELVLPEAEYFYISRRAATVACIRKESDIVDIVASVLRLSMGNLRETLEQRLGKVFDKCDPILNRSLTDVLGNDEIDKISERVLKYKAEIQENAAFERENYFKYLKKINLSLYNNIFLFDLYSRGTNVTKLGSLLDREVKLLCYAVKDYPNEYINSENKFKSMFDSSKIISGEWFRRCYQLFEIVYASSEGQLECFNKDGLPLFTENSQYNYGYIQEVQKGITAFINDLDSFDDNWYRNEFSLDMVDFMCGMLAQRYSVFSPDIRNGFLYQDSFSSDETINIWDSII